MLRERLKLANEMIDNVDRAEDTVDDAFTAVNTLLVAMDTARKTSKLDRRAGRAAFTHISSAVGLLGQVRDELFHAHDALREMGPSMVPTVDWGDQGCAKPQGMIQAKLDQLDTPLRAVR